MKRPPFWIEQAQTPKLSSQSTSLFSIVTGVLVGFGIYKVLQDIFDDEFEGRDFPKGFRHNLISEHLRTHGAYCPYCPECRRRVRWHQPTVDHVAPWAKGGRTSRENAQVMCRSCSS